MRCRVDWPVLLTAIGASSVFACGSPGEVADAGPTGPDALDCFDGGMPAWAEEGGAVEIGTGQEAYEPVEPEQELPLYFGVQGGYHFDVRTRIEGLHPGEADNNRSPENPYTLVSAYDDDGDRADVHTCGFTLPYGEDGEDGHDLGFSRRLLFSGAAGDQLDGERVQIVAEVLDHEGRYARSEVWVVADVQAGFTAR